MFCCFITAFIAVLTMMVMVLWNLITGGGGEKTEFDGGSDNSMRAQDSMTQFVNIQAAKMSPENSAIFKPALTTALGERNIPPMLTLDDITGSLEYDPNAGIFRTSEHIGQRKLFLTELQFFVDKVPAGSAVTCVYAGAAPSNHTGMLSDLFPNIKFILVDPNPFDVFSAKPVFLHGSGKGARESDPKMTDDRARALISAAVAGSERIYVINDLMTMEIARACADLVPGSYFISDIRTNASGGADAPDTADILWNLSQQYNWMCAMKPAWSMLKFRHPFYAEAPEIFEKLCREEPRATDFALSRANGIDFVANQATQKLIYWAGEINIQAFPGPSSTETRLITDGKTIHEFGAQKEYESKLFYYNSVDRCWRHHANANASAADGFDHCNDCAIENHLWEKYVATYAPDTRVIDYVRRLSGITHRNLLRGNHGRMFGYGDRTDWQTFGNAAREFQRTGIQPRMHSGHPGEKRSNEGRGRNQRGRGGRGKY